MQLRFGQPGLTQERDDEQLDVGVGHLDAMAVRGYRLPEQADARPAAPGMSRQLIEQLRPVDQLLATAPLDVPEAAAGPDEAGEVEQGAAGTRSEEARVGKGWVSTGTFRWWAER